MTKSQAKKIKKLMPLIKAIREKCLDCSANSSYEVKMCVCPDCPLYPYREGLNSHEAKFTRENKPKPSENTIRESVTEKAEDLEANK